MHNVLRETKAMTCKSAYITFDEYYIPHCSGCGLYLDRCISNVDPKDIPAGVGVIEFEVSTN